jgi:signal transduction histidine kinase
MMSRLRPHQLDERLAIRSTGDELDQLSSVFNRLLDRIGSYLQERREFLANAAHELRTPLAAIHASAEVALKRDRSQSEYQELLAEIIEESQSLKLLVNQLLFLSESETEWLKWTNERVLFNELVEKAIDMFSGVAEFRGVQLVSHFACVTPVQGNREHLRQVIYNLLDNALKFTPAGGLVTASLRLSPDEEWLEFKVQDSGPGIPADELPKVFDRFFRGNRHRNRTDDSKGTGLGLSICQAIVHAHEGTIAVESELNHGTLVTVRLKTAAKKYQ